MPPFSLPYSAARILQMFRTKKDSFWTREREKRPFRLFHEVARRVPAYKDFLKKNGVNPQKIRTFKDLQLVPPVSKKNYLRQYPLEKLCWDGNLRRPFIFTATSGSTGDPFYFPRDHVLDWQSAVYHEFFIRNSNLNPRKPTLVIVGFGMGVWIGGIITYQAFEKISQRGYPLTILTPGSNKKEIFEALRNIGPKFDQVILCGYPPFIKDVIDEAPEHGVEWRSFKLKIVFAAEAFSEKFRNYIVRKTGIENKYTDTMNIYGSADLGTMAEETPVSILAREVAMEDAQIHQNIFDDGNRTPTLAQYNPLFINFDVMRGEILCTGNNALPLVRYAIGDRGAVSSFGEMAAVFRNDGFDLHEEAKRLGFEHTLAELPFVHVYERSDLSTKLYGAIIYPEHVKEALHHEDVENFITGKFKLGTEHDKKQNEYLEVNIELKPRARKSDVLKNHIRSLVVDALIAKNAEFKYLFGLMPDRIKPKIVLWKHQHPLHFKPGIKQKWVKRLEHKSVSRSGKK